MTSNGLLTASNLKKKLKIPTPKNVRKRAQEMKKVLKSPPKATDDRWKADFMFYGDLYMDEIGMSKSNLLKQAVNNNKNNAKSIHESFRKNNDKEKFKNSIKEFLDDYIKQSKIFF